MLCVDTEDRTELTFVQALMGRVAGECRGPLAVCTLGPSQVYQLERIFECTAAGDVLWSGFQYEDQRGLVYSLCAAHWFDLATLVFARAIHAGRRDWATQAQHLLRLLCEAVHWDAKEIVNMLAWQRSRLT